MTLYNELETKTSYRYLQQVVNILDEPICILGGWAVYLIINDNFQKEQGRNYLGSRDIDLGYYIDKNFNKEQLKNSSIAKSLSLLQKEGFKPLGFRYYKEIHYETGKELTSSELKQMPTHNIFTMYIDPIVNEIHPSFQDVLGFSPVDEPLLTPVFKDKRCRTALKEFDRLLWVPKPEILVATKIRSVPNRTQDEKLVKDICDIYALGWYSGESFQKIKNASKKYLSNDDLAKLHKRIKSEKNLFEKVEVAIDIKAETVKTFFDSLLF